MQAATAPIIGAIASTAASVTCSTAVVNSGPDRDRVGPSDASCALLDRSSKSALRLFPAPQSPAAQCRARPRADRCGRAAAGYPARRVRGWPATGRGQTGERTDVAGLPTPSDATSTAPHAAAPHSENRLGVLVLLHNPQLVSRRERSAPGPLRDLATQMVCHDTSMGVTTPDCRQDRHCRELISPPSLSDYAPTGASPQADREGIVDRH